VYLNSPRPFLHVCVALVVPQAVFFLLDALVHLLISSSRAFSLGKVSVIPSKLNFYSLGLDHIKSLRKPVTDVSDELIKLPWKED
jgi:hypothetical protein